LGQHFKLRENFHGVNTTNCIDKARTGFVFIQNEQNLLDSIANGEKELSEIMLGTGFRGITDIKTSLDGLYILTFDEGAHGEGKIYRISH